MRKFNLKKTIALTCSALALAGLIVSGYLTWEALITPIGSCPLVLSGFFGCSKVLSSSYSRIGGLPTATLGLGWFIIALGLTAGILRNSKLVPALLAWSLVGLAGVIPLVYIELFVIGAICPFCTAAHLLELGILGLALLLWKKQPAH